MMMTKRSAGYTRSEGSDYRRAQVICCNAAPGDGDVAYRPRQFFIAPSEADLARVARLPSFAATVLEDPFCVLSDPGDVQC
jgi:hypothetical protein